MDYAGCHGSNNLFLILPKQTLPHMQTLQTGGILPWYDFIYVCEYD